MALVNRAWREGEFVPPGSEPGLTDGREWRDTMEQRAVEEIAQARFSFPTAEQPELVTHVNVPARSLGVRAPTKELLFPDIVVVDRRTTEVQMLAEVETPRSLLTGSDLQEKWRAFASAGPLYLFVPMSHLDHARRLLKQAAIKPAGLRAWRRLAGMNMTDIVNVRL